MDSGGLGALHLNQPYVSVFWWFGGGGDNKVDRIMQHLLILCFMEPFTTFNFTPYQLGRPKQGASISLATNLSCMSEKMTGAIL